jgi:hypothetical protein
MRMIIICVNGGGGKCALATSEPGGSIMRARQDIWLDWATGILVALGIVAIVAGSALIAWMSWQST